MAMTAPLRRALASASSGNFKVICTQKLVSFNYTSSAWSYFLRGKDAEEYTVRSGIPNPLELNQHWQRGFAKAKKSKGEDSTIEVLPDIGPSVKSAALTQMEAALEALSRELNKLRSGRASAGMLDHIVVESHGVKTMLSRLAAVTVIDSQALSVTPYDADTTKEIERAIVSSPLGLNPANEGQRLVVPVPQLTKDRMQAMLKLVAKAAEDVKQSIRRARQKAVDTIKKAGSGMSKDDVKRLEKEIDEMTKKFVKSAEDMCKAKEKEVMGK